MRVAELRQRGLTYGEIGAALGISKPTRPKDAGGCGRPETDKWADWMNGCSRNLCEKTA